METLPTSNKNSQPKANLGKTSLEPYDSGWKRLFYRLFFIFLEKLAPDIWEFIDTSVEPDFLDKELKQLHPATGMGHRDSDMLVKVRKKDGEDQILLIHVEFQTQVDVKITERSFIYALRIFEKFGTFPITLLVLADTNKNYRPAQLNYRLNQRAGLTLDFPIIKILDYLEILEELKLSNHVVDQVIAVYLECQTKRKELKKFKRSQSKKLLNSTIHKNIEHIQAEEWFTLKTRIMRRLVRIDIDEILISEVLLFLEWLIMLPKPFDIQYNIQLREETKKKEGTMGFVTSWERYGRELGLQEGLHLGKKEGLRLGKQEGRQEGLQLGQLYTLQQNIYNLLDKKYGLNEEEKKCILDCHDIDLLNATLEIMFFSNSKQEVFDFLRRT